MQSAIPVCEPDDGSDTGRTMTYGEALVIHLKDAYSILENQGRLVEATWVMQAWHFIEYTQQYKEEERKDATVPTLVD